MARAKNLFFNGLFILGMYFCLKIGRYSYRLKNDVLPRNLESHPKLLKKLKTSDEKSSQLKAKESTCEMDFKEMSKLGGEYISKNPIKNIGDNDVNPPSPLYKDTAISLDKNKFIVPLLLRGPNNQLKELRMAVFIAIALNRTLVIPRFFKHFTDINANGSGTQVIHPYHRINIPLLCQFIPCITLSQFKKTCQGNIDAVFQTPFISDGIGSPNLYSVHLDMRIKGKRKPKDTWEAEAVPGFSDDKRDKFQMNDIVQTKFTRNLFGSTKRCAALPLPFYGTIRTAKSSMEHHLKYKKHDIFMMDEVIKHTTFPKYIDNMAENFIHNFIKEEKYLAVHWRFDREDWGHRCFKDGVSEYRSNLCNKAFSLNASTISKGIAQKAGDLKFIYIAAPMTKNKLIQEIKETLQNNHGITTITSVELMPFVREHLGECGDYSEDIFDILSTAEMMICKRSHIFLYAKSSSWSRNVSLERSILPKELRDRLGEDSDVLNLL